MKRNQNQICLLAFAAAQTELYAHCHRSGFPMLLLGGFIIRCRHFSESVIDLLEDYVL